MCGIIGYFGTQNALPILFNSLHKMEYRGYDSSGIAYFDMNKNIKIVKDIGTIQSIIKKVHVNDYSNIGIGHTRWATHGKVTKINSHPIYSKNNLITLVHNGIIENHFEIKKKLIKKGYSFITETDTECLVQLIDYYYRIESNLEIALEKTLFKIQGSLGIIFLSSNEPNKMLAYKAGSPLIIGQSNQDLFIASDIHAITPYTKEIIYLEDQESISISKGKFVVWKKNYQNFIKKTLSKIHLQDKNISKKGYNTYMLKEIDEQPQSIKNCIRGRLNIEDGNAVISGIINLKNYPPFNRIIILGMGSSYYSGMIGKYLIEEFTNIPTDIEYSSEFCYRNAIVNKNTLIILISQSGETADTILALKEAKLKGAIIFSICNTIQSYISRKSDEGMFLYAGPEISVASTKCFTSQIVALNLIALSLGRSNQLTLSKGQTIAREISKLPSITQKILDTIKPQIHNLSLHCLSFKKIFFLGRNYHYPIALEAALKLMEICYIPAQGFQCGEMKHGPLSLVDSDTICIFLNLENHTYSKTYSNISEIYSRNGKVIVITNKQCKSKEEQKNIDSIIEIPKISPYLSPILAIIPLQLLTYYMAKHIKVNIDQPRNLAKSVTVE